MELLGCLLKVAAVIYVVLGCLLKVTAVIYGVVRVLAEGDCSNFQCSRYGDLRLNRGEM